MTKCHKCLKFWKWPISNGGNIEKVENIEKIKIFCCETSCLITEILKLEHLRARSRAIIYTAVKGYCQ